MAFDLRLGFARRRGLIRSQIGCLEWQPASEIPIGSNDQRYADSSALIRVRVVKDC